MSNAVLAPAFELDSLYVMHTYNRQPIVLERGEGVYVWDTEGKRYMDWVAGIAVNVLGHSHPAWVAAIRDQVGRLAHTSNHFVTGPGSELAREIVEITGLEKVFYTNSGTEANEAAIKIARKWGKTQRGNDCYKILTFDKSFHGRTYGGMSATAQEKYQKPFTPMVPGFVHLPLNDMDAVRAIVDASFCGIMLETIQGEGGVRAATPEFLRDLRAFCNSQEILLILDEVQCGMGRTGRWMAYEHADVLPDIAPLAKALGGGFPIGACVARGPAANILAAGEHGSTYAGGPLATAAGLAVVRTIRSEGLIENASQVGGYLRAGLERLVSKFDFLDHVRGLGLMLGLEFRTPVAREVARQALPKGLLLNACADTTLRIVPPLILTQAEADEGLAVLEQVLSSMN